MIAKSALDSLTEPPFFEEIPRLTDWQRFQPEGQLSRLGSAI